MVTVIVFYQQMKRREYFKLFYPLVIERSIKRALVLMGPRRVGKTVMLFHAIDELINVKKIGSWVKPVDEWVILSSIKHQNNGFHP
jgi:hypothetical protein